MGVVEEPGNDGGGLACPSCGYSVSGLTVTRCPECGGWFDPAALKPPPEPVAPRVRRALPATCLVAVQVGGVTLGGWTGAAEPFYSLREYAFAVLSMTGIGAALAFVPTLALMYWLARTGREKPLRWTLFFTGLALVPSTVYVIGQCVLYARLPGFDIFEWHTTGSTPAWIHHPVFGLMGNPVLLLVGWFAAGFMASVVCALRAEGARGRSTKTLKAGAEPASPGD